MQMQYFASPADHVVDTIGAHVDVLAAPADTPFDRTALL